MPAPNPLSVGHIRRLIADLPDDAEISPDWFDGPPGDDRPAVVLHAVTVRGGELLALVSLIDLDDEDAWDFDDDPDTEEDDSDE